VLPDAKKNARNVFDRKLETKRHAGKEGRKKKKSWQLHLSVLPRRIKTYHQFPLENPKLSLLV
jgi:hypothetical protein